MNGISAKLESTLSDWQRVGKSAVKQNEAACEVDVTTVTVVETLDEDTGVEA